MFSYFNYAIWKKVVVKVEMIGTNGKKNSK